MFALLIVREETEGAVSTAACKAPVQDEVKWGPSISTSSMARCLGAIQPIIPHPHTHSGLAPDIAILRKAKLLGNGIEGSAMVCWRHWPLNSPMLTVHHLFWWTNDSLRCKRCFTLALHGRKFCKHDGGNKMIPCLDL